jgi:hypothetical protein
MERSLLTLYTYWLKRFSKVLYSWGMSRLYPFNRKQDRPQSRYGLFGEDKYLLSLAGIEVSFLV